MSEKLLRDTQKQNVQTTHVRAPVPQWPDGSLSSYITNTFRFVSLFKKSLFFCFQGFDYWWGFPLTNLKDFGDDIPLKWVGRQWKISVAIIAVGLVLVATAIIERKLDVIGELIRRFW